MPSTGVLMRLTEIKGNEYSVDEVILPPKTEANWLRFPETKAQHRIMGAGGQIEMLKLGGNFELKGHRSIRELTPKKATVISNGQWHRFINPSADPLTLVVKLTPPWNPQRAHFRLGNREFRGDEVWFEVKTHLNDKTARAMYMLHELSAARGFVSVRLNPKVESLECYHKTSTVSIKGVKEKGVVRINGTPRTLGPGEEVVIKPGQRYQLQNPNDKTWEVEQTHKKQWEPEDTFYVLDDKVIPGDQVWFEFVVPD